MKEKRNSRISPAKRVLSLALALLMTLGSARSGLGAIRAAADGTSTGETEINFASYGSYDLYLYNNSYYRSAAGSVTRGSSSYRISGTNNQYNIIIGNSPLSVATNQVESFESPVVTESPVEEAPADPPSEPSETPAEEPSETPVENPVENPTAPPTPGGGGLTL